MTNVQVELKVCEGCGALWIRTGCSMTVYCRRCAGQLAEFPAPRRLRRRTGVRATAAKHEQMAVAGGAR